MKNIFFVSALMVFGIFIWATPLTLPSWFYWLTFSWQILLSTLLAVLFITVIFFKLWYRRKVKNKDDVGKISDKEKLIYRKSLCKSWRNLWKKISSTHGSNPYKLPWLFLVGPNNSGKSLWLNNAGFIPIKSNPDHSQFGISFWLGKNGVVVEISQTNYDDKEAEEIHDELYYYVLKLLKSKRPRQPLTAILSMVPADELVTESPFKLQDKSSKLHEKLSELNKEYRIQIPVWILVSKADQFNGFSDFFRNMSQQEQSSPWGFSSINGTSISYFSDAFRDFYQKIFLLMPVLIQKEKDQSARQSLVRFILQLAIIGDRLNFYCTDFFQKNNGRMPLKINGVWFFSNTQESITLNVLACELGKIHGFQVLKETQQPQSSQRYFNHNFLEKVIYSNMGRLPENPTAYKFWRLKTVGISLVMILMLAAGLTYCWHQVEINKKLANDQIVTLNNYSQSISQIKKTKNYIDAIEPLYSLKNLDNKYKSSSKFLYHFGLNDWEQSEKINSFYLNQLKKYIFSPLEKSLYNEVKKYDTKGLEGLYNNLRFYLALYHPDKNYATQDEVVQWAVKKWSLNSQQSYKLKKLVNDLWKSTIQRGKPDFVIINIARKLLAAHPMENIIYHNIINQPQHNHLLTMEKLFGSYFDDFFLLKTDFNNSSGIPAIYTVHQYHALDLSANSTLLKKEVSQINLIRKGEATFNPVELNYVSKKIRSLYFQDYIETWQNLLNRIVLKPAHSFAELTEQIYGLYYGEQASLLNILKKIAYETQQLPSASSLLSVVGSKQVSKNSPGKKFNQDENKALKNNNRYLTPVSPDSPEIVSQFFIDYANLEHKQVATLKPLLFAAQKVTQEINASIDPENLMYHDAVKVMTNKSHVITDLWKFANLDNTIIGEWIASIANALWRYELQGAERYIQNNWEQSIYTFYFQNLKWQFPLNIQSSIDCQLDDFIDFFKINGRFDHFIKTAIRPFIYEKNGRWQPTTIKGQHISLTNLFLNQINTVAKLQKNLFNKDKPLQVHYNMRATHLSPKATELSIRDNNGKFMYQHGPRLWVKRQWPTSETDELYISLLRGKQPIMQEVFNGSWGWLHFIFGCNQWKRGKNIQLNCSPRGFPFGLEINFNKRINPFDPKLYQHIKLPKKIINKKKKG
ncbi:MAG: type VI secretion system membrane subunit TssM [Endozoicomonas sp. (ex Botrylloides leachii)]|nr:type VI secretion system membrane subunit TssM [Endozoicomonas sp. (ex Botrylloides leachii)]